MRLAAAVLALAFLGGCGDSSAKPPRPTPWPAPATAAPAAAPSEAPAEAVPPPAVEAAPPQVVAGASAGAPPPAAAEDFLRRKVQFYFQSVDYILRSPKHGVPAELGDTGALLAGLRGRADRVRSLEVPEPCAAYHRQLLEMLDSAMSLVDRMHALGAGRDQSTLVAFAADRRTLDEQERQLDSLAAGIRQAPAPAANPAPSGS